MKKLLSFLLRFFYFLRQILLRFLSDSGPQRAAGLAFSTLMATVPLFAVLIGFGGPAMMNEKVHAFLGKTLLPAMQEPIMGAILDFVENSKRLGVLGIPFFLVTVSVLLNNIEVTLNHIFRVSAYRDFLRRAVTYMAVIIFAAFFIGASITLSGDMIDQVLKNMGYTWIYPIFKTRIASFLFIFLGQFILLTLIPGRRVHPGSAFVAALTGSILWELCKRIFGFWATQSIRMSVIYGSMFMVPLLLIWLMVVWIILLLMAELTYVHQHRGYFTADRKSSAAPAAALINSLRLYNLIVQAYQKSRTAPELMDLSKNLDIPERDTENLLQPLLDKGILLKVILGKRNFGYVPARPVEDQDIGSILKALSAGRNSDAVNGDGELLRGLDKRLAESLYSISVKELLKSDE